MNNQNQSNEIEVRFGLTGALTLRKLLEYLPAALLTNLSTLLLITVDGIVVGNLIGKEALSTVSVFYPVMCPAGAFSQMIATGIGTSLSLSIADNDKNEIRSIKATAFYLMIISALLVGVLQIPVIFGLVYHYGLSVQMRQMTLSYAIGIMISMPFGLISNVGVSQLVVTGRLKTLVWLSALEGGVNLILDLLFVGCFGMGIAGAGYGTMIANIVRCSATVLYLWKATDIYKIKGIKPEPHRVREMVSLGLPDFAQELLNGLHIYFIVSILMSAFGSDGGVIRGVCLFCFSLSSVLVKGITDSLRPLAGLMSGIEDREGMRLLMRQSFALIFILVSGLVVLILAVPSLFYRIHGVHAIPAGGLESLRIYAVFLIMYAFNTVFRVYFINRKDTRFATLVIAAGNIAIPILAFILAGLSYPPLIWLAYPLKELVVLMISVMRYRKWRMRDNESASPGETILYMSVRPEEAIEASRMLRTYADSQGYPSWLSYRISLCMEEMVAYCAAVRKKAEVMTQEVIRITDKEAVFQIIDNGRCTALNEEVKEQELVTDNYELIRRLATSLDYQFILKMNYTIVRFILPENSY